MTQQTSDERRERWAAALIEPDGLIWDMLTDDEKRAEYDRTDAAMAVADEELGKQSTEIAAYTASICRDVERLRATEKRVRALHQRMQRGALTTCRECSGWDGHRCRGVVGPYPCATITALDGPQ